MPVPGFQTISMIQYQNISITRFSARKNNRSLSGRMNGSTHIIGDVQTFMHSFAFAHGRNTDAKPRSEDSFGGPLRRKGIQKGFLIREKLVKVVKVLLQTQRFLRQFFIFPVQLQVFFERLQQSIETATARLIEEGQRQLGGR